MRITTSVSTPFNRNSAGSKCPTLSVIGVDIKTSLNLIPDVTNFIPVSNPLGMLRTPDGLMSQFTVIDKDKVIFFW